MNTNQLAHERSEGEEETSLYDNGSKVRRPHFLKLRIWLGNTLFKRSHGPRTWRIGPNSFLKAGKHVDMSEAHAMRFVAENTSIPVPKLLKAWSTDGITFIVMDFVGGHDLWYCWSTLSVQAKERVFAQLKQYIGELRSIKPPDRYNGAVCSVDGKPIRDIGRIGLAPCGPFSTQDEFHTFLRGSYILESPLFSTGADGEAIGVSHSQTYATKFTHGDLAPRNVLVKKDGTITAIVDWDCAGWFPEYWEFTKAKWSLTPADWEAKISDITGEYLSQLAGERAIYRLFGTMIT